MEGLKYQPGGRGVGGGGGGRAPSSSPGQTLLQASSSRSPGRWDEGERRSTGKGRGPGVWLRGAQELRAVWGLWEWNRGGGR